ncbi:MAG: Uncharacterised protein [Methanobacteriota archaeon]|nr:hypothetical protein [Euryarchaeota archaeon]CAI8211695.1 MAG: Uncharacterised protein [Euryarchaeota archaeon]
MPRTRALLIGIAGAGLLIQEYPRGHYAAVTFGLVLMILVDAPHHASRHRHFRKMSTMQSKDMERLNRQLRTNRRAYIDLEHSAQSMQTELERRDAVGAPEARRLLDEQRRAMSLQSEALREAKRMLSQQHRVMQQNQSLLDRISTTQDNGVERWEQMMTSIERLLDGQARRTETAHARVMADTRRSNDEVTRNNRTIQDFLSEIVTQMARIPREQTIQLNDSVLMSEAKESIGIRLPELPAQNIDSWVRALEEDLG